MQDADYAARIDAVKQRAHGRWSEVLAAAGIEERAADDAALGELGGGTERQGGGAVGGEKGV